MRNNKLPDSLKYIQRTLQDSHTIRGRSIAKIADVLAKASLDFKKLSASDDRHFYTDDAYEKLQQRLLACGSSQEIAKIIKSERNFIHVLFRLLSDELIVAYLQRMGFVDDFLKIIISFNNNRKFRKRFLQGIWSSYRFRNSHRNWYSALVAAWVDLGKNTHEGTEPVSLFIDRPEFLKSDSALEGAELFADWAMERYRNMDQLESYTQFSLSKAPSYFQPFILNYLDAKYQQARMAQTLIQEVQDFFGLAEILPSTFGRTYADALAILLLSADMQHTTAEIRSKILTLAQEYPNDSAWFQGEVSEKRRPTVERAVLTLRKLRNQIAFHEFLDVAKFDQRRKGYWEKLIPKMDEVYFYVNRATYQRLRTNYSDNLSSFVKTFVSVAPNSPPVLIMRTKNKLICEFGVLGNALYIFDDGSDFYRKVFGQQPSDHSDLKQTRIGTINSVNIARRDEGKVSHSGSWQMVVDRWLKVHAPQLLQADKR